MGATAQPSIYVASALPAGPNLLRARVQPVDLSNLADTARSSGSVTGLVVPGPAAQGQLYATAGTDTLVQWTTHPSSKGLLLPRPAVEELDRDLRWRASHFITPSTVGLIADTRSARRDAVDAAWRTIAAAHRSDDVLIVLQRLLLFAQARRIDMPLERWMIARMSLPEEVTRELHRQVGHRHPLLDPRALRWIITELCVASVTPWSSRRRSWSNGHAAVMRLWMPWTLDFGQPPEPELLRAVWFLLEAFELRSEEEDASHETTGLLAVAAAHMAGERFHARRDDQLARAAEMFSLDDDDPHLRDSEVVPSELRADFRRYTGLEVRDMMALTVLELVSLEGRLHDLPEATALLGAQHQIVGPHRARYVRALRVHLGQSPRRLGREVLKEMRGYGEEYTGLGSVPRHAHEAVRVRPLLRIGETLFPLGLDLMEMAVADLPVRLHGRGRGIPYRTARGKLGGLYEARLVHQAELVAARRGTYVATERDISSVTRRGEKRPDLIIGSGGDSYLAVEITVSRLETGVRSASATATHRLVRRYLRKRKQAEALVLRAYDIIPALTGSAGMGRIRVVPLVVTDEPLPLNPAFERAVRAEDTTANPRFICSVEEFERLLELGLAGWDLASLVDGWQRGRPGRMLGTHLDYSVGERPKQFAGADLVASRV